MAARHDPDHEPIPRIEGESTYLLDEEIAYVPTRTDAQHSVMELRQALAAIGSEEANPLHEGGSYVAKMLHLRY